MVYENAIEAGNKLIANVGLLKMYGKERTGKLTRLHAEAFKDATEILQYLENDPRVVTAGLSSAIRKERGFERFSVRIKLADVGRL